MRPPLQILPVLVALQALSVGCVGLAPRAEVSALGPERPPAPPLALGVGARPGAPSAAPAGATREGELEAPSHTLLGDLRAAPGTIAADLGLVFWSWDSWSILAVSYLGTEALDLVNVERAVNDFVDHNDVYPDSMSRALARFGEGELLFAGAGLLYLVSDEGEGRDASRLLLRSLASTGISTLALKALFRDQRPNGSSQAYPSGHTSMTATAAASLWHSWGPKVGIPATLLATMVGVQRVDSRAHELDDVLGGAVLGWLVAKTLHDGAPPSLFGARVLPSTSPEGDPAVTLAWSW